VTHPGGLERGLQVALDALAQQRESDQDARAGDHLPPGSRGVIGLLEDNCTVCMLCARECPDWCIYIDSHKETVTPPSGGRPRVQPVLDRFAIDFALCMYCGICVEVCPFDALFWAPEFAYAETDLSALTHERERLREWMQGVPPPLPVDPAADEVGAEPAAPPRPPRGNEHR
jgi:NADH-quinone oxidoreductase subunit I